MKDAPAVSAESAVERRTASTGIERRCGCVDGRDSINGNERWAWRRKRMWRQSKTGRDLSGTENWQSAWSGGECETRWETSGVRRAG